MTTRACIGKQAAPKGMIVSISQALARLFQSVTLNPKAGGGNWLKLL